MHETDQDLKQLQRLLDRSYQAAKPPASPSATAIPLPGPPLAELVRERTDTIRASAMASQKTRPSEESAEAFIAAVPDDRRRRDAQKLCGLLAEWTGEPPAMWGNSIVGFGRYRYRYDSGHEGTAALVGFSPRKTTLVLYLVGGIQDRYPKLLQQLGPHEVGKGCLYLKHLDDVDHEVLHALVERTVRVHRGADRRASTGA